MLCILTFEGSRLRIVDGFTDYLSAENAEATSVLVEESMENALDNIENSEITGSQREVVEGLIR